jgi:hypothetical protein
VRTPKHAVLGRRAPHGLRRRAGWNAAYRPAAGWMPFGELALGAGFAFTAWRAAAVGDWAAFAFYLLFGCGFLYVGASSVAAAWGARGGAHVEALAAAP